ncbi:Neuroglobin [Operophtera brumata]|uniref:Neuroglobin n=1 Tax=Operophtera brumata TaxID=104452 RepID=A0A0L7L107_OPEBR|nr:Neuroglobin [Operophtera brumata]
MGCQLGKLAASERRGNNPPALSDGPPPATDPRLPLTAKQKYSMLASWKEWMYALIWFKITLASVNLVILGDMRPGEVLEHPVRDAMNIL